MKLISVNQYDINMASAGSADGQATPAFPATRYFVAQHAKTHGCSIATTTPDGETMVMVGKAAYKSAAEATAAMAVAKECKI
jgi:hypothetical protein